MTQTPQPPPLPPPAGEKPPSPAPAKAAPATAPQHRHGTWWFPLIVLVLLAAAAFGLYRWISGNAANKAPANRAPRPVAVAVAPARRGDLPVYLNALGTVNAYNTVTVRSRVDGQLDLVNFTEGQTVQAGAVLAKIDPRPFVAQLHQAQGQLARDQASLASAQRDLDRYEKAGEAASQQQRDTALGQVDQFKAAIEVDNAQIESADLQVHYCTITAPLTGRLGLRVIDQGNMIHASDPNGLVVITQIDPIAVVFSLPQDNLPQILHAAGDDQALAVEAYSRDLRTKLGTGTLLAVDNQIDPGTATARFKARFDNAQQRLFPNQFVNVRLLVDTRRGAVLAPASAVQRSPQGKFVYVVGADDTVALQAVKEGPSEGDVTLIEEGLQAGQEVVTDGADKLVPGALIVRQAATQPATRRGAGTSTAPATSSATMVESTTQSAPATTRGSR